MSSITKAVSCYSAVRYLNFINKNAQNFRSKHALLFHTSAYLNVKGQGINMPSLSPTMSEGKIVKWLKKEGDPISPGDVLCDIETDKAVVAMETEEEGILAKILVPENSQAISVGTLIALMVQVGENWQEVEFPSEEESAAAPAASSPPASSPPASSPPASSPPADDGPKPADPPPTGPVGIQINMPSLSPTMSSGTILKWLKKEGDKVSAGDVLCDIQTDKAVISFESDEDGILAKILVPENQKDVEVGTLIALLVAENEDWQNVVVPPAGAKGSAPSGKKSPPVPPGPLVPCPGGVTPDKPFGPAVRSIIEVYRLDIRKIKATGRNNMLLKEDVLRYIEENKLQKKPPKPVSLPAAAHQAAKPFEEKPASDRKPLTASPISDPLSVYRRNFGKRPKEKYIDIELSNVRKVIAKRLSESKWSAPHTYGRILCKADKLIQLRKDMNSMGLKASMNDYIIKGTAVALESCPKVNSTYENDELRPSRTIDISIAVATAGGLITPIVTDVGSKSILDVSKAVKDLVGRARDGKLKPHEFQGGSFTISNLGMFGIKHFTAIINPPQCAILAVGTLLDRFGADGRTHYDIVCTLSYDRRALLEDEAAEFLEKLKCIIENPKRMVAQTLSERRALGL